jgi:hypothetical protein
MDARMNLKINVQINLGACKDTIIRRIYAVLLSFELSERFFTVWYRAMDIMVFSIGNFVTSKGITHVCALEVCIDGVICNAYFFQHGLCSG